MSAFAKHAQDYLALRRALGHKLDDAGRMLPRLVAHLDATETQTLTVAAALAWAQLPDADPASSVWPRRMTIARGFARYLSGIDAATDYQPASFGVAEGAGFRLGRGPTTVGGRSRGSPAS